MLGSSILEVAIGMIFVYLLVSLMLTTLTEIISTYLKMRANNLWDGICNMVDSSPDAEGGEQAEAGVHENWVWSIYNHPLIKSLMPPDARRKPGRMRLRPSTKGPSYIPARTFAMVVLDLVRSRGDLMSLLRKSLDEAVAAIPADADAPAVKARLKSHIEAIPANVPLTAPLKQALHRLVEEIPDGLTAAQAKEQAQALPEKIQGLLGHFGESQLGKSLSVLIADAKGDAEKMKENVEVWFNNSMERVAGWYKRKIQKLQLVLALGLAIALNVDSLQLMRALQSNTALRQSLVAQAEEFQSSPQVQVFMAQPANPAEAEGSSDPAAQAEQQTKAFEAIRGELEKLDLPIGWSQGRVWPGLLPQDPWTGQCWSSWFGAWGTAIGLHFWGWLLTALAASLGAPFWFDMLNKVINIRSAGKAPEEKPKNPKEVPTPVEPGQSPAQADAVHAAGGKS